MVNETQELKFCENTKKVGGPGSGGGGQDGCEPRIEVIV